MAEADRTVTAKSRYAELKQNRKVAEDRAKKCAKITIPALWIDEGAKTNNFTVPYQSTGARCVNSMASHLLLASLPANATFFKLSPDFAEADQLIEQAGVQKGDLEEALSEIERAAVNEIETTARLRALLSEGFKHVLYSGNFCMYIPDTGPSKLYPLTRYVVDRDGLGTILEMVTLDYIAPMVLPEATRNAVLNGVAEGERAKKMSTDVELYTHITRDETNENWVVYQEVEGNRIPETEGTYPIDSCPWIVAAVPRSSNEDYGRGLIEDYRGEFESLEALRKALRKGAAAAAKILWLLDPTSPMKEKQLVEAESGAVIRGNKNHLSALTLDKFADMQFVRNEADTLKQNLEMVFGVATSVQRKGERVTADEISKMLAELENLRAGTYAIIGEEILIPMIHRVLHRMTQAGSLPELPKGMLKPRITVGTAALGRGHDMEKLLRYGEAAKNILGEQEFKRRIDAGEWLTRLGAAADISTKGLVLDPETVQQNDQNTAMTEAAVRAAPQLAQAALPQEPMM